MPSPRVTFFDDPNYSSCDFVFIKEKWDFISDIIHVSHTIFIMNQRSSFKSLLALGATIKRELAIQLFPKYIRVFEKQNCYFAQILIKLPCLWSNPIKSKECNAVDMAAKALTIGK